nr:MAG TPA: hypothetical protein [Caudoviricetes sp.]
MIFLLEKRQRDLLILELSELHKMRLRKCRKRKNKCYCSMWRQQSLLV